MAISNRRRTVTLLRIEEYHLFPRVFRKEIETFSRNRQFQSFSTNRGRVIACRRHLEVECNLPPIRKGLGRPFRFDSFGSDVATPLSRAESHYLAEGAREGGLIAEARLNCYVRNRRGRLPK